MEQLTLFDLDEYIENVSCPLCGGTTERKVINAIDNFYVAYLECMSCGHTYNTRREYYVPDK